MKKIDKYISEIYMAVEKLKKRDPNCSIAYRGESRDYEGTKLMPTIFRNDTYVEKEIKLFQLLKDYGVTEENASQTNVLIEAQHFAEISRALDISFSIITALYFACSSEDNMEKPGKVYVFGFPEYVSPHSKYIDDYYKKNVPSYNHNFKVISYTQENERIKNQKGGFIFFQGMDFVPLNSVYYREVEIASSDKKDILEQLELLFSVNEASIYPDRDRIAKKVVKPKFEEISASEDEFSMGAEILSAFSRLKYEAEMEQYDNSFDKIKFLRKLRKEKNDLNIYVSENEPDASKRYEYEKLIESQVYILGGK